MRTTTPDWQGIYGPVLTSADEELARSTAQANASAGGFLGWLGRLRQGLWNSPIGQRTIAGMQAAGLRPQTGFSETGEPIYSPAWGTGMQGRGVGSIVPDKVNPAAYEGSPPLTVPRTPGEDLAKQRINRSRSASPVADLMRYGRVVTMRPGGRAIISGPQLYNIGKR